MRLHVRAIVRDGSKAFVGSQSLRKDELDNRREVGLIINNPAVARKILQVFDADWADSSKRAKAKAKAAKDKEKAAKIRPPPGSPCSISSMILPVWARSR